MLNSHVTVVNTKEVGIANLTLTILQPATFYYLGHCHQKLFVFLSSLTVQQFQTVRIFHISETTCNLLLIMFGRDNNQI